MKNNYIKPFSIFNEALAESALNKLSWYYGIADCHGLESFVKEPNMAKANELDDMFDLGLSDTDSKNDPVKKKYIGNLALMKSRCDVNLQRHPVIYRVKLAEEDADMVEDLLSIGDYINALNVVKGNSEEVQ